MFLRDKPYNSLPLLPPPPSVESIRILRALPKARAALAELKSESKRIPNQEILIDSLTLLEAKDSSEIENILTTHDKLYQAELFGSGSADASTKEVTQYRQALFKGVKLLEKRGLTTNTFIEIVQTIKMAQFGIRNTPGAKIVTPSNQLIYTPPEGEELLRGLLLNLEVFIHNQSPVPPYVKEMDPLIKMAIIHYQFEAIHPFSDGNGRTGRIINILYLLQEQLLDKPVLFLSRHIIDHKEAYYKGLQKVTEENAWEDWILYMIEAVEKTSQLTIKKIDAICKSMEKCFDRIQKEHEKMCTKDLIEVLYSKPFISIASLVDAHIAKYQTASLYLKRLVDMGLLRQIRIGKENAYINVDFHRILKN